MNKLCIFLAGSALGSAITYVFMRKKFTKEVAAEADAAKAFYSDYYNPDRKEERKPKPEIDVAEPKDEGPLSVDEELKLREAVSLYTRSFKGQQPTKEEVLEAPTGPVLISDELYREDHCYEKVSLLYYEEDYVLYDEAADSEVDDPYEEVGTEFVNHFGDFEPDVAYVKNDASETMYEIIRVHDKFRRAILGEE